MPGDAAGPAGFRRAGALVTALFGLPWALTAAGQLPSGAALVVGSAALATTASAVVVALLPPPDGRGRARDVPPDWRGRFDRVGTVQAMAIVAVVAALVLVGQPTAVPAAVCLVVGLHFVPLTRLFDQPQFRSTAAGLCLVAAVAGALHLSGRGETAVVVAGSGAAVVLWATSLHIARVG